MEAPFSAHVVAVRDPRSQQALKLEGRVFLEEFGNTEEELAHEYGSYEPWSIVFFIQDNINDLAAGMTRVILPNGSTGLKSVRDIKMFWPELAEDQYVLDTFLIENKSWDIGTLAIGKDYQGPLAAGIVSLGLYQAVTRAAKACGIDLFIAILDNVVYRMSRWKYYAPWNAIPGSTPKPYLGSKASTPVYSRISEWGLRLSQQDPIMYEVIYEGRGLENAVRPLDLELAIDVIENCVGGSVPASVEICDIRDNMFIRPDL